MRHHSVLDSDLIDFVDEAGNGLVASIEGVVDKMFVESELHPLLDFLLGVVQSLLDHFGSLSASLLEPLFQGFKAGSINEEVVAIDVVVMYFLCPLDVDIQDADLRRA